MPPVNSKLVSTEIEIDNGVSFEVKTYHNAAGVVSSVTRNLKYKEDYQSRINQLTADLEEQTRLQTAAVAKPVIL